ncbi:MAG: amidohydrolase family protein, partial [Chthoniobacteraceae bacterium]
MQPDETSLVGIRGWLIDAPEYGRLRHWQDGALILDGRHIVESGPHDSVAKRPRSKPVRWLQFRNAAIFPGLIDIHAHVPQYPAIARGQNQLLPWLRTQIFPLEKQFTGAKGRREAGAFFSELARHGTTTAMLYAAIYEDSCEAAFHAAAASGLRIILGKMMMDVGSYGQLQPTKVSSVSLHESERLCRTWHGARDGLLEYVFSPRFAVSCSAKLMRGAAELAEKYGAYLQTHLSENREEMEKVRHQFPGACDYTDVYAQCGMLSPRTILGHCLHLADRERAALAEAGCAVAHCPTANMFLGSGIMPLDKMRAMGLRIGLGSDVGA